MNKVRSETLTAAECRLLVEVAAVEDMPAKGRIKDARTLEVRGLLSFNKSRSKFKATKAGQFAAHMLNMVAT